MDLKNYKTDYLLNNILTLLYISTYNENLYVVFSGSSGAEQPGGCVSGAGAAARRARNGCSGGDSRPDSNVRKAGGAEVHSGQHSSLR